MRRLNMQKAVMSAAVLAALVLTACTGEQEAGNMSEAVIESETQAEETSAAQPEETSQEETSETALSEEETAELVEVTVISDATGSFEGIVVDAAMHSLTIVTEEGELYSYAFPEDAEVVETQDGLMLGQAVAVDSENGIASAVRDGVKQPLADRKALAFAADILLAFQYQDMDSLANLAGYPLQVNLGEEEMTAEDGGAFLSLSKGQIFTEERVQAVVNCNLYALEELDGERYVLGAEEGGPNVIFQKDSERDSGFTIVEIN